MTQRTWAPEAVTRSTIGGQLLADVAGTHAGDEGQPAGLAVRVQLVDQAQGVVAAGGRAELDADRVADAGEEVDVGVVQLAGALPDPEEVRRGVVGQAGARVDAGQGALVVQQQGLVAGVELHPLERLEVGAAGGHELDGAVDVPGQGLVAGVGRVLGEALVPLVHQAQVREAALGEGADQVQRGGGGVVGLEHPAGVVGAGLRREVVAVDDVAAVGRQGDAVAGLVVGGAGLGELAGHAAHLDDGHRRAVGEHDGHLQDGLDAGADLVRRGGLEGLGAVAALEQERLALRGGGEPFAQDVHFAGENEGREDGEFLDGGLEDSRVRPAGLLGGRKLPPVVQSGIVGGSALGGAGQRGGWFLQIAQSLSKDSCPVDVRGPGLSLTARLPSHGPGPARGRVPRPRPARSSGVPGPLAASSGLPAAAFCTASGPAVFPGRVLRFARQAELHDGGVLIHVFLAGEAHEFVHDLVGH